MFRQICGAVQHAHQKGIIHRDLKPTNILVEDHDGQPVPKVIDFGLAKAISGLQLTEQSLFTAFGSITGTPLYMAPEQATFNAIDVDTRADIYALGVILYELLTGSTPIRKESLLKTALEEMLRVIREDEPPTPSSRISTSEGLPSLAAVRLIEPSRLGRFVRGDLDWIVMKALAKERVRRYDSAIGLANDVERFLNDEPVTAGPPTARYRTAKFIRRHRGQVVAVSLLLLALIGGVVGTTLGLLEANKQAGEARRQTRVAEAETRAKDEAQRAEAQKRREAERLLTQVDKAFAITGSIFEGITVENAGDHGRPLMVLLGERLDQAAAQLDGDAIGDPLTRARAQYLIAKSNQSLGFTKKAIDLLSKSRAIREARLGPDHPDTLLSMAALGFALHSEKRDDQARPLLERTLVLQEAKLGPDHADTLETRSHLAGIDLTNGQPERAAAAYEQLLAGYKARGEATSQSALAAMNNLAICYNETGRRDRGIALLRENLALREAQFGRSHHDTLHTIADLGRLYCHAGQQELGLPLLEESFTLRGDNLGADHEDTLNS